MKIFTMEEKRFSGITESLYVDYGSVKALYPYDYKEPGHWNKRLAWLGTHPGADRELLSYSLNQLNQRLRAETKTLDNIKALANPESLVVVTGQQTGLFTGPLYTLYKAITVIKQAQDLSKRTGRPVIPVFWMATEDHDFAEIAMNWHFDGQRIQRLRLGRTHKGNKPVGPLPVTTDLVQLCEEVCAQLGSTENADQMRKMLKGSLEASNTLGDWFGRLLLSIFAPWGLVVLDPSDLEMRRLMIPFFKKALEEAREIHQGFQSASEDVKLLGYAPEVIMGENQTGLFLIEDGERLPLYVNSDGTEFRDRDGKKSWSQEQLLERLIEKPETFSTGVVLRPVVQDWLLPVVAAVLGPSEAAYHGQLGKVFEVFQRELPIIVPRESWALVPNSDFADVGEIISLLNSDPESWLSDRIMDLADEKLRGRIVQFNEEYKERYAHLIDSLPLSTASRDMLLDRAYEMQIRETRWMMKQLRKSLNAEAEGIEDYKRFARVMKPMGKVQERTLTPWYFLSLFGMELIRDLISLEFSESYRLYIGGNTL